MQGHERGARPAEIAAGLVGRRRFMGGSGSRPYLRIGVAV